MKVPRPAVKLPADSVPVKILLAGELELIGNRVDALPTVSRPLHLTFDNVAINYRRAMHAQALDYYHYLNVAE